MTLNQGLEYQSSSDSISCQFVNLQRIEETPCSSQNPKKEALSQPSIYILSGSNAMLAPPHPDLESDSTCNQRIPGTSSVTWYQLPGIVRDESDIERRQSAQEHTTTLHDSCDNREDEPAIPDLNNQTQNNIIVTKRVTFMLFVVTLVFFVTYAISSLMLFLLHGIVRYCFRDFVLINHVINPVDA